jgi:hypothetical protein
MSGPELRGRAEVGKEETGRSTEKEVSHGQQGLLLPDKPM